LSKEKKNIYIYIYYSAKQKYRKINILDFRKMQVCIFHFIIPLLFAIIYYIFAISIKHIHIYSLFDGECDKIIIKMYYTLITRIKYTFMLLLSDISHLYLYLRRKLILRHDCLIIINRL